jgi:F-type H+-transporting ATPase subunit k
MFFIGAYALAGTAAVMRPKAPQPATPPIQASSSDEEAFIKEFLAKAEQDEKKN